jgi:hypothetical protein
LKPPLARRARINNNWELLSKPRSSRGNEAQTEENMEPPHVGCYGFEIGSLETNIASRSEAGAMNETRLTSAKSAKSAVLISESGLK